MLSYTWAVGLGKIPILPTGGGREEVPQRKNVVKYVNKNAQSCSFRNKMVEAFVIKL